MQTESWAALLPHRTPEELERIVPRLQAAGLDRSVLAAVMRGGDRALAALLSAGRDPRALTAVALACQEARAYAEYRAQRAEQLRMATVDRMLNAGLTLTQTAGALGVSRRRLARQIREQP